MSQFHCARDFADDSADEAWTATAVAAPKGTPISYLWDVACPAALLCVTVGTAAATSGGATPQALAYNGKTWSRQAVPAAAKGKVEELTSVSCPSAKLCVALGASGASRSAALSPLAGFWNGKGWRLAAA